MKIVTIQSHLLNFTPYSIQVEFRMYSEYKTEFKSVMWSKFIHIDMKEKRSTGHSQDFMKLLSDVKTPEEKTFEERVKNILKK